MTHITERLIGLTYGEDGIAYAGEGDVKIGYRVALVALVALVPRVTSATIGIPIGGS